jgi:hypothetical protein
MVTGKLSGGVVEPFSNNELCELDAKILFIISWSCCWVVVAWLPVSGTDWARAIKHGAAKFTKKIKASTNASFLVKNSKFDTTPERIFNFIKVVK